MATLIINPKDTRIRTAGDDSQLTVTKAGLEVVWVMTTSSFNQVNDFIEGMTQALAKVQRWNDEHNSEEDDDELA